MSKVKDPVNLSLGDKISAYAGRKTRTTHQNSLWVTIDPPNEHFRSEITLDILNHLPGRRIIFAPDGIGTKVALIDAACGYKNAARDIIAMTAGDITRSGGCPVIFSNVLDVSTLGVDDESATFKAVQSLFDGLVEVANLLKFACVKGETAELSACVASPNPDAILKFNWAGFMLGVTHKDKCITGETLAPGQVVVALREYGFRSNGISAVRTTLQNQFGAEWWKHENIVEQIATPSTLYDHFLTHINGWHNIENNFEPYIKPHLICHLSGGSFKAKFFEDILKRKGLSAQLHNLWEPALIVRKCADWSGMSDELLYEKWSCGQGALVVLDHKDVGSFIHCAEMFGIEAKAVGEITKEKEPSLSILSKFSLSIFKYT
jgi:phosphoribosylformylglycinamidine cyclo-ligase